MVELTFAIPVFFFLVFGIVEWALVREQQHALANGVRAGARSAVVGEWGDDTSCGSYATRPGTARVICNTKAEIGERDVEVLVLVPDYDVGEVVTVCAQRPVETVSGLLNPVLAGKQLQSETSVRIEELGVGGMDSGGDVAPGAWSWCG